MCGDINSDSTLFMRACSCNAVPPGAAHTSVLGWPPDGYEVHKYASCWDRVTLKEAAGESAINPDYVRAFSRILSHIQGTAFEYAWTSPF